MAEEMTQAVRAALREALETQDRAVREIVDGLTDQELWQKPVEPGNSVGHLVLHLTGNLKYFVGAQLGGTGYVRDREREFTEARPPSREALLVGLEEAVATFKRVVGGLGPEQLLAPHPEARFGSVLQALIHLVNHFALHRGQMSYIARLVK